MTEEFAVKDNLKNTTNESIEYNNDDANHLVDLESTEENLGCREEYIRDHVELSGVFAVFGGFILREGPFAGTSTIKSIGEFGGQEDNKSILGGGANES